MNATRASVLAGCGGAAALALVIVLAIAIGIGSTERARPPALDPGVPAQAEQMEELASEPASARAPAAPMLAAQEEELHVEPARRGKLLVRLVTADGEEVTKGRVVAKGAGIAEALVVEVTDQRPVAEFENVGPGEVYLVVELDSLPEGYFPPREQMRRKRWPQPGALVEVAAGETVERALLVERGAYVHGRVWDEDPRPIEGAYVRFGSFSRAEDGFGTIDIDVVGGTYGAFLPSGRWMVRVQSGPSGSRGPGNSLPAPRVPEGRPRPLPIAVDLDSGTSTRLDFEWAAGPCELQLVMRDQYGAPFSGLLVLVYPRTIVGPSGEEIRLAMNSSITGGRTDAAGVWEAEGLVPGAYAISFEPEGFWAQAPPGRSVLGEVPQRVEVELEPGIRRLERELLRACPVLVTGRIRVADGKPRGNPRVDLVLAGRWRKSESRYHLELGADGAFSFHLEAAERDARLELTRGDEFLVVPIEIPASAQPGTLAPQGTIAFPQ